MMEVSVIISFRGDATKLLWALAGFAEQQLPAEVSLDVRVGGDGCAPPPFTASIENSNPRIRFSLLSLPRSGAGQIRNLLITGSSSEVLVFANADTRPDRDFVAAHLRRLLSLPDGTMVLGNSPYEESAPKTVFDVLKEDSPMVFFYDRLKAGEFYDYRHAWTLNLSCRRSDFERAGGFSPAIRPYYYEDIEFAFKLMGDRKSVYYDPAAIMFHRHPMTLDQYLDREETIGCVAPNLSRINPRVFASLFGSDDLEKIAGEYRAWTAMDRPSHRWIYQRLCESVDEPEAVLGTGESRQRLMMTLYQMHIPLKRLAFRLGFLRGMEFLDDARWQERGCKGLWREAIK